MNDKDRKIAMVKEIVLDIQRYFYVNCALKIEINVSREGAAKVSITEINL